ncbi:MAG: 2-hydroxyacid dehydrogenase [Oleiphilaceae bacterium]|nr:2-hydroxyacid dehydrogenase [Oleiphilaceae bacterium]
MTAAESVRIAMFSTKSYEKPRFAALVPDNMSVTYQEARLTTKTTSLAVGHDVVCCFTHDQVDAQAIASLADAGIRLIALRSAGFNNVDLRAAENHGIPVVRVPAYSPFAVAEHAMALVLCLNRKIHKAHNRVRELNFSLEGLEGFDLHGKTFGIVGTGEIGEKMARIAHGFGCRVIAYSKEKSQELMKEGWVEYVDFDRVLRESDVLSLHVPLTPETDHLLDAQAFERIKPGAMLINTGRGALIDASALVTALKKGQIGSAGLDVYEEEEGVFFEDLSDKVLQDDVLARLLTFNNVLITSHQAFLTREALDNIASTTVDNIRAFFESGETRNAVTSDANMKQ